MRPRTLAALAVVGLALAALPASGQARLGFCGGHGICSTAASATNIGTGAKTCTLKPGADCRGVVHRWGVEHHGNLRKINLRRADLRGADFRGADLRGADLRGAILRHVDLRDARLEGARLSWLPRKAKGANEVVAPDGIAVTNPLCAGADLKGDYSYGVDLGGGLLAGAQLEGANLSGANLSGANLWGADLYQANLFCANLSGAIAYNAVFIQTNVTNVDFRNAQLNGVDTSLPGVANTSWTTTGAIWGNTTCPNGTVTNTGC